MAASRSRACIEAYFEVPGKASRPLQLGYEAVLNGRAVVHRLARELPFMSADLMEIAATVYAVDRLVARSARLDTSAGSSWARDLRLGIPVREPQLWSAHAGKLTELLRWLTDDDWSLEFFQLTGPGLLDEPQAFLRRQALHACGKTNLDAVAGYRTNPSASTFTHQAMLWQVARLRACLGSPDPWQGLVSEFPEILDTTPLIPEEVISLYRSYVQEWEGVQQASGTGRTAA